MTGPGFLRIAGRQIETGRWGPTPDLAPTLVLLHEGLGSVGLWRGFPAALAEATGCAVFAYSRFGYGGSDTTALPRPFSYMHDEAEDVLPRVLDAAGIGPCVLVGHSDGASIAAIYAGAVSDPRVLGLVLIAPHFFAEEIGLASVVALRDTYAQGGLRCRLARHHDDVDTAFHGWAGAWLDPAFRQWDITGFLPGIRVPMLIVQGEDDAYGTAAQWRAAERLSGGPVRTVVVPRTGHAPQLEAPDFTLPVIAEFARSVLAIDTG